MYKAAAIFVLFACILLSGCVPTMPPPPDPSVVIPARPRSDALWVPGHYKWRSWIRRYVWVPGHWKVRKGRGWVVVD
jgi:hypothetical protein